MALPLSACKGGREVSRAVITPPNKRRVVARQLINLSRLLISNLTNFSFDSVEVMILLKHSQLNLISNIDKIRRFFRDKRKPVLEYLSKLIVNLVINSLISRGGSRDFDVREVRLMTR